MKKVASVQNVIQTVDKGYESVPTKTPNRSEYHAAKNATSKHKSIIVQSNSSQPASNSQKPDGSVDDGNTEKAYTESPSKHRKFIRGF